MNAIPSLAEVFSAWESLAIQLPHMRAGQLVAAVGELCHDLHGRGLWDASDEELLEALWQYRNNLASVTSGVL